MQTKAVQLLVNEVLPDDLKDYNRVYNKKTLNELLTEIYTKYPEKYGEIVDKLADIGRNAVYFDGESISLKDFMPVFDKDKRLKELDKKVDALRKTVKDQKKLKSLIEDLYTDYSTALEEETIAAGKLKNNAFYNAVESGARGNKTQLKAMITTPSIYTDYKNRMIPIFIRNSYAEGLTPAEYLSSTYGTRSSVLSTKKNTAKSGGLAKEINRAISTMVVTKPKDFTDNGIDLDINDESLHGRVLARNTAGLLKGTVLDRDAINHLRKNDVKKVIVKSPLAAISETGITSEAIGLDYNRELAKLGYQAGLTAGTALTEPMTQSMLCLEENTEVRMADGKVKKIKDIEPGDMVLGADKNGNTFPVKVLNKFDQGMQNVNSYTFKTSDYKEATVICTPEHKFLFD